MKLKIIIVASILFGIVFSVAMAAEVQDRGAAL